MATIKSSTADAALTRYVPHGRIDCHYLDNLMYFRAIGPFNEELFEAFAATQRALFQRNPPPGPWASVCTIEGSALATHEGLQVFAQHLRAPKPLSATPRAVAFVMGPGVEAREFMAPQFAKIYASVQQPFQVFETETEAETWARSQLKASP